MLLLSSVQDSRTKSVESIIEMSYINNVTDLIIQFYITLEYRRYFVYLFKRVDIGR